MAYNREEIINYAPGGDSVKSGIEKLDTDLTGAFTHLNNHAADTSTHGVGSIVGVGEAQTLANKTISLANNTVSGTLAQFNAAVSDADLLDTATAASTYAPVAKGVTNGDAHDHSGGDGAQIAYSSLSGAPTSMVPPDGDKGDVVVSGSGSNWTVESVAGNLSFTGTGARIRGDFSNATIANRAMFQTSTANAASAVGAIPNGTGDSSSFVALNTSDSNNAGYLSVLANNTTTALISAAIGTGTYLPMTFHTGGTQRLNLATDGTFTSVSGAIGYGTGAGGTVTQATNKSTAVTLNKPCGQITMNNSALAAGARVQFTLNNSLVTAIDNVIPTLNYNMDYTIDVVGVGAGTIAFALTNVRGISLSDAVVINFAIIKGAIS